MKKTTTWLGALALALTAVMPAMPMDAQDLDSGTRIKIHRAKLRAAQARAEDPSADNVQPCQTGNLDIGTVEVERGARVPHEVMVYIDGDVINLNDGRTSRVCR